MEQQSDSQQERNAKLRIWLVALTVCAFVLSVDQITKSWAENALSDSSVHVVGPMYLTLAYNKGIAFGLGSSFAPVLVPFAIALLIVAVASRSVRLNVVSIVAFGVVLGGAIGNATDRLTRGRGGAVVDFINIGMWPVFNLADAAIVCGTVVLTFMSAKKQ